MSRFGLRAACGALLSAVLALPVHAADPITWMHADPSSKSVRLDIAMGAPGEGSGLNFNGYSHGHMTITVPLGWKVSMKVTNADSLPHSLEIVAEQTTPPIDGVETAFPRAETIDLKDGMPPNASDSLSFTADKAGRYWIMCAVPGHVQGGMWDLLVVSETATAPVVTFDTGH
jgi:sulfocyanin